MDDRFHADLRKQFDRPVDVRHMVVRVRKDPDFHLTSSIGAGDVLLQ
jgi:hypothetical protein